MRPLRDTAYQVVEPLHLALAWPSRAASVVADNLQLVNGLQHENRELREQNILLSAKLQKLSFLASDNERLRGLHAYANSLTSRALISEIIAIDADPMRQIVVINRGRQDGIYSGQVILSASGVLGRVIQVGTRTSRAMLITDKRHSVPVRINRNGIRAILSGTGAYEQLRLQYVPEKSDIQVGDLLVTSGLGLDFPEGYPVARVMEITHQTDDQFLDVTAEPVSAVQQSRYVLALFERPVGAQYLDRAVSAEMNPAAVPESVPPAASPAAAGAPAPVAEPTPTETSDVQPD